MIVYADIKMVCPKLAEMEFSSHMTNECLCVLDAFSWSSLLSHYAKAFFFSVYPKAEESTVLITFNRTKCNFGIRWPCNKRWVSAFDDKWPEVLERRREIRQSQILSPGIGECNKGVEKFNEANKVENTLPTLKYRASSVFLWGRTGIG